jgi:hypothetical protein
MSQSAEQMQAQMRAALNLIAADQAALRLTMQSLILNLFSAQPDSAQRLLENMKRQVLESLSRMPTNEKHLESARRTRELHVLRAEQLFKELEQAFGKPGSRTNSEPTESS